MTTFGGDTGDMADRLTDAEVDSLVNGLADADPTLAELLGEIRFFSEWTLDPALQTAHVSEAVTAASGVIAGALSGVAAAPPAVTRRNWMFRMIMTSRLAQATATVVLVLFATGGAAYAGVLPDPIQNAVSNVAQVVGLDIDDGQVEDVDDGAVGDVDEGQVEDVDDGAVGDVDEGEVDDVDHAGADDSDNRELNDSDTGQSGD